MNESHEALKEPLRTDPPGASALQRATAEALSAHGPVAEGDAIVERVREEIAPHFAHVWQSLADHPLVGEVRSVGMMGAIELVSDKVSHARFAADKAIGETCRDAAIEQGLVMRHVRDSMIVAPPLVITTAQLDELAEKARRTLDVTWSRLTS